MADVSSHPTATCETALHAGDGDLLARAALTEPTSMSY
jgi:hypothetical protein